ncbi:hypothetical protein SSAG_00224 [Streptomyces sp. Mg1]|nr:hypothetical protein SSAG_00224 [Streptomyces sp. Mg1]
MSCRPLRRPDPHGRIGAPLHLPGPLPKATPHIQAAVSTAWQSAISVQRALSSAPFA